MVENYREPEDLLSDESFLSWYFKTGAGEETAWEHWMASSPDHKALADQAVELLNRTRLKEKELSDHQQKRAEAALMEKIAALTDTGADSRTGTSGQEPEVHTLPGTPYIIPIYKDRRWIAAACILIVLTTGLFITRALESSRPEVKTAYGQIKAQQLPDGTEVTMNANSRLSYLPGWKDGADREVWVNGEAFFHVRKTPEKSRFIVHTDHFDVIVTGTQFNVVNRHGKANVMLQEGSVTLRMKDGRELKMLPGDFVAWDGDQPEKRNAKNDSVLAWKEQKLVFDKTPLRELVTIINDQYGVNVQLSDDSIGDRTISAILPNNNLDVLLQALDATSEFEVIRQPADGNNIIIRAHTP